MAKKDTNLYAEGMRILSEGITITEVPKLEWDTCQMAQDQAKYLQELAKEEGEDLSEEDAFTQACEDSDLQQMNWDDMCEELSTWMNELNPKSDWWVAAVSNFGWRHQDGVMPAKKCEDGSELLRAVLPDTDCTFTIYKHDDYLIIANSHHDAPIRGSETYRIEPAWECNDCGEMGIPDQFFEVDPEYYEDCEWLCNSCKTRQEEYLAQHVCEYIEEGTLDAGHDLVKHLVEFYDLPQYKVDEAAKRCQDV